MEDGNCTYICVVKLLIIKRLTRQVDEALASTENVEGSELDDCFDSGIN